MGPVTVTISKQVWIQKWERRPQCQVNSSIPMKAKIVCVWVWQCSCILIENCSEQGHICKLVPSK